MLHSCQCSTPHDSHTHNGVAAELWSAMVDGWAHACCWGSGAAVRGVVACVRSHSNIRIVTAEPVPGACSAQARRPPPVQLPLAAAGTARELAPGVGTHGGSHGCPRPLGAPRNPPCTVSPAHSPLLRGLQISTTHSTTAPTCCRFTGPAGLCGRGDTGRSPWSRRSPVRCARSRARAPRRPGVAAWPPQWPRAQHACSRRSACSALATPQARPG